MKKINVLLTSMALVAGMTSCDDHLDVVNLNNQTTYDFGNTKSDLEEAVIACYNRIRLEGTFARVGYTMDAVRGDEVWNASQQWYLAYDNLNSPGNVDIGDQWIWRDNYHVVNRCNFVLSKVDDVNMSDADHDQIKGQALFLRGLAYYTLATYYQTVPLFVNYSDYSSMNTMYAPNVPQDEVFDQIELDFKNAMDMLPSREKGGEWALGRATCGAAAGYYARALMFRHKYSEALTVLKDIIAGKYGHYELMKDYGYNFREDTENNAESLFEVQFMDYGTGGPDDEWTPVNISSNASQGHAVESNYASGMLGSWGDLAGSPWLYNLFKAEKCTDGTLDPRLYWTLVTYEPEYSAYTGAKTAAYPDGDPRSNVVYMKEITSSNEAMANSAQGGISIAKFTNARNNIYESITTGLKCGINLRMMRYSDVLLRAAECINEISGPSDEAIGYINQVRQRVALAPLKLADFPSKDKLFEQIANVERPKEFGCENGRGIDLLRWGFFYAADRRQQLVEHGRYVLDQTANTDDLSNDANARSSFLFYHPGHEYFPIYQGTLSANLSLHGNSANNSEDNTEWFVGNGWTIHPVVNL